MGKLGDVSRKVYQKDDIDWDRVDPETGLTNKQLAESGRPPKGSDGLPIELHHVTGREPGAMIELEATTHDKYSKQLHNLIISSFRRDLILNKQYKNFRYNYWKWRARNLD